MSEDILAGVPENLRQHLLLAKAQTQRTGMLVDGQVYQLRLWPRVVLDDVVDLVIDPLDVEGKVVHYLLRIKKVPRGEDLAKRMVYLEKAVHWLLGDEWVIVVKTRQKKGGPGKLLYRGRRTAEADASKPTADLEAYEYQNPLINFRRYKLSDPVGAAEAASQPLPPIVGAKR